MSRQNRAGFNTRPDEDADSPVVDNLLSTRTASALSARQGSLLHSMVQGLEGRVGASALKSLTISAPVPGDKVPLFYAFEALTLTRLQAVVAGASPSVSFTLRHGADLSGAGTEVVVGGLTVTSTTTGLDVDSFDSPVVPEGAWLWLDVTATSGTVSTFSASLGF